MGLLALGRSGNAWWRRSLGCIIMTDPVCVFLIQLQLLPLVVLFDLLIDENHG